MKNFKKVIFTSLLAVSMIFTTISTTVVHVSINSKLKVTK